jgi:hypothetical protein
LRGIAKLRVTTNNLAKCRQVNFRLRNQGFCFILSRQSHPKRRV